MTLRTGTRLGRVKRLARAGSTIALWAMTPLVLWAGSEWVWVAIGCAVALAVAGAVAAILELPPERRGRGSGRKGNNLSGRGRDDDGPADEAVHRWRTLAVVSRLMPASAGRRWRAEAESLLAEVTPAQRGAALRSYLLSAPRLAVMMWAWQVVRRLRPGPRRPG
jgi:hypothetical protein